MERVYDLHNRIGAIVIALVAAVAAGCSEKLEGGAACPSLCPEQEIQVRDTILEPISLDTTLAGYPTLGVEPRLLLAARGDTLDVRAVVRFDTLPPTFTRGAVDSAIYAVDSAYIALRFDNTGKKATAPVTIEAYDVDTPAPDTSLVSVLGLFTPGRIIGSVTLTPAEAVDSVRVPLSNAVVLTKILARTRLRVGLRVTSTASAQLQLFSIDGGSSPRLSYDPSADTAVKAITVFPTSRTPVAGSQLASDFTDYQIVARGANPPAAATFAVGGTPGRRAYLRFALPPAIADSSTVLRATLTLTQRPDRGIDDTEPVTIYPQILAAGPVVTDLAKAALLLVPRNRAGLPTVDSLRVAPADSGARSFEIAAVIQEWRARKVDAAQRVLVLQANPEGTASGSILFFSSEAPVAVRPRLRISYVSRLNFGVP